MKIQYPVTVQESWLLEATCRALRQATSSNPVIKRFVENNINWLGNTSIVRVFKFLQTTNSNDITAIVSDSSHKMLAIFPFSPTIVDFEQKHQQRITFNSANCLFLINEANLRYINKFELATNFDSSFNSQKDVFVLEVLKCEVFQRDQVSFGATIDNLLKFVYVEYDYNKACSQQDDEVDRLLDCDYDEMVSL